MKTAIIDIGRELTHEECVELAKAAGIEVVFMVEHEERLWEGAEQSTEYKVTGF